MHLRARAGVAAIAAAAVFAVPSLAEATFVQSSAGSTQISSGTLRPPSSLTLTSKFCGLLLLPATATLSWTATPDTFATGYEVSTTRAGGTPVVTPVSGRTTTSTTVTIGNYANYTITVSAAYRSWDSTASNTVTVYCGLI